MKIQKTLYQIALFTALTASVSFAQASVAYNLTGWDATGSGGLDGGFPANWVGGAAPSYTGSLNAMWYADVAGNGSDTGVSTSDARSAGADPNFALAVGPMGWSTSTPNTGNGHGADFGLIQLDAASNLTITVAADSIFASTVQAGFSLFQGWDSGAASNRYQTYLNNQDNPLGTTGLVYLNGLGATTPGGTVSFTFVNLSAGDYTLFIGGNYGGGHDKYTVDLSAAAVPVPGAIWLFGSVLLGYLQAARLRTKV